MMILKDIENRGDVHQLVVAFYTKVQRHEVLGDFFNTMITDWEEHFNRLTKFWTTSLFIVSEDNERYYGNPLDVHIKVDKFHDNKITSEHFGLWMNLWFETIDEMYTGEIAERAKRRAQKMNSFLFLKIFEARNSNNH